MAASDRREGRITRRVFVLYIQISTVLILVFSQALLPSRLHEHTLIYLACVFLTLSFLWSLWSWRLLGGKLSDPYILFIVTATVFNGGQAFLEVFGLNSTGILRGRFSPEAILATLTFVILGLASFHLGGLIAAASYKGKRAADTEQEVDILALQGGCAVGLLAVLIALVPTLLILRESVSLVMSFGYFSIFTQEPRVGIEAAPRVLATFLVPGSLFLLAVSAKRPDIRLLSLGIVAGYSFVMLFIGQRYSAMLPLISYMWLRHRVIRPLPRMIILALAMIALVVVVPLVRAIRNIPGEQRLSINFLLEAYRSLENPAIAAVSELGGTMATVAYTMDLVPKRQDFNQGLSYLFAASTIIPNILWEIHPAQAHSDLGAWLIAQVDPYTAERGGTIGYSFIAEAYFNFGWYGAPIILGLFGFLYARLVLWAERSNNPLKLAVLASYLAFFLFFARAGSGTIVRPLVWYALSPYLGALLLRPVLAKLLSRYPHLRKRTQDVL